MHRIPAAGAAGWGWRAALALVLLMALALATAAATGPMADARKGGKGKNGTPTCFGLPATVADHKGEIVGTSGDDVIVGDGGPNRIFVNTGDEAGVDRVCGGGGDDFISKECCGGTLLALGGTGDDHIIAGTGDAVLFGGDGDDRLVGSREDGVGLLIGDRGLDDLADGSGAPSSCQQDPGDPVAPC